MREEALQYASRGWPVFRLTNYKTPFKGSHGHLDATTDRATIEQWWTEKPGACIGLATGQLIALDPDGAGSLERLAAIGAPHGGWPRTLTAKTPRGFHIYYLAPQGVEIRSYNEPRKKKGDPGIDIKGRGGYTMLPPSKSGQYQWISEVPLAVFPEWAVEWYRSLKGSPSQLGNSANDQRLLPDYLRQSLQKVPQNQGSVLSRAKAALSEPWSAFAEARIISALRSIPATGYDQWLQIGMALHSLDWRRPDGTLIGLQLFNAWSATEPDLYSSDAVEKKWNSFGKNDRYGIGLGTVFHTAESHGWQGYYPPADESEVMPHSGQQSTNELPPHPLFDPPAGGAKVNGHASAADVLPDFLTADSNENPLIDLNKRYAVIGDVGGKCLVLGWVPSKVDSAIEIPSFQSFKSFSERYAHKYVMVRVEKKDGSEEEAKQLGAQWLKWKKRQTYEGIDLDPAHGHVLPNGALNLWRGFAVEPAAGAWPLMQAHIAEVLSEGDAASLDYILRWSAWAVQNPGARAESALVFRGGKGSGKGTFAHALRRLFGTHGLHISNPKHLVGAFNAHLRNCLLLYADEAFWAGDKQGESTLKALITESTLTIEQKGVDAVQWNNRIHLIMTANADWVVPASHDERRYAVFNVGEKRMNDTKYFNALHAEIANGGLEAMLYDLLRVDLKGWHPRQVIHTRALMEQKQQSMQPIQEWWEAMLQEGMIPSAPKDAPDIAQAQYLLGHAREFAPKLRDLTATRLGRFLSDHGCIKLHRANGNAWRFPLLGEARAQWDKRYQGWSWEKEAGAWCPRT